DQAGDPAAVVAGEFEDDVGGVGRGEGRGGGGGQPGRVGRVGFGDRQPRLVEGGLERRVGVLDVVAGEFDGHDGSLARRRGRVGGLVGPDQLGHLGAVENDTGHTDDRVEGGGPALGLGDRAADLGEERNAVGAVGHDDQAVAGG